MNRRNLPVQRLDVWNIADELADVLAQLQTGLIAGYDPIAHLKLLLERTWEASYLSDSAAAELREQRWQTFIADCDIRDELSLPERSRDGMLV